MRVRMFISAVSAAALYLLTPDVNSKLDTIACLTIYYAIFRWFWAAVEEIARSAYKRLETRRIRRWQRRRRKVIDFRLCEGSGRVLVEDGDYVLKEVNE